MAISVVQSNFGQTATGNTYNASFGSGVTSGNTLFLAVYAYSTSSQAISSNSPTYNGSAYAAASIIKSALSPSASRVYCAVWMFPDIGTGGGTTLGATIANGVVDSNVGWICYEVSGLGATPTVDQSSSGNGASGNISSGASGAITAAPEFVIGTSVGFGITQTAASGFTNLFDVNNGLCEAGYQIPVSSGGTYTYATNTGVSADWAATVTTVYAPSATGVAGTVQPRATVPVPRRRPARGITGFTPVATVNTGHGPAGRAQPLAASLIAPRRKPGRAVVQFTPVTTTNAPAKPHPQHGTPSSDEARGFKRWLLWGP